MAALPNRQFRESSGPLHPLPRAGRAAPQDWLSEFPQEPATPSEPAMWVEVPHPHIAPPAHTEFRPFSPVRWIRANPSTARAGALAIAVISTALLGLAAWPRSVEQQEPAVITQSATSDPLLARPIVTPPPAPPTVFTSQAATPSSAAATGPAPARGDASARVEEKKPAPPRAATSRDGARTTPARATGFVPPLPPDTPPARSRAVQPPPPLPAAAAIPTTITTSRPPVDSAPLILSSPVREPAVSPVPAAAPAPPPPPSPEARDKAAVDSLLERYRLAFSTLNSGVSDFWPGVNSRALDKAFNDLDQQRFEFDQCRVQLNGAQADATCTGTATFVQKVGNKTPRTQPRQWSFRLVRAGNRWIIDSVQVR
ncbi:MAG TPA: hypothetical protein VMS54_05185 [Vicinamibacterales bacterium]|nr:hypothetical protein [Vicinamibacterales bacterium]